MHHTQIPAFSLYLSIKTTGREYLHISRHTKQLIYRHLLPDKTEDFTGTIPVRAYTYPVHSTVCPSHKIFAT